MIKNIEFRKVKCTFQTKLIQYIEKDKLEQQFYVSAFEALENFYWLIEEKCFLICGYCFIELCVKPNNISTSIFRFMSLIFGVFKSTLNSLFFRASSDSHFAASNIFSIVSLGWNCEFVLWHLVSDLLNSGCKKAYPLAFRKDDKFHFTD